jgi:hypothetical protein
MYPNIKCGTELRITTPHRSESNIAKFCAVVKKNKKRHNGTIIGVKSLFKNKKNVFLRTSLRHGGRCKKNEKCVPTPVKIF